MRSAGSARSDSSPNAVKLDRSTTFGFGVAVDIAIIIAAQYGILFTISRTLFHHAGESSFAVFHRASFHVVVCCAAWLALQFARAHIPHTQTHIINNVQHWLLTAAVVLIPFASDDIRSFLPPQYHERGSVVLPMLLLAFTFAAWSLSARGRIAACVCYQILHVLLDAGVIHAEHDPFSFWLTNSLFVVCSLALDVVSAVFCRKPAQPQVHTSAMKAKVQAAFNEHAYWLGLVGFGNAWLMQMFCLPEILILRDNVNHSDVVPHPFGYWQRDWPCRGSLFILSLYTSSHSLWLLLGIAKRRKLWMVLACAGLLAICHLLLMNAWPAYPLSPLSTMTEHIRSLTNTAHK